MSLLGYGFTIKTAKAVPVLMSDDNAPLIPRPTPSKKQKKKKNKKRKKNKRKHSTVQRVSAKKKKKKLARRPAPSNNDFDDVATGEKKSEEGFFLAPDGDGWVRYFEQYLPVKAGKRKMIFAGLDAPANTDPSRPYDNPTSRRLANRLGAKSWVWIDFALARAVGDLSAYDRDAYFAQLLNSPESIADYESRLSVRIIAESRAGNGTPVVYLCGKVVNKTVEQFTGWTLVRIVDPIRRHHLFSLDDGTQFIAVVGHVHPSAIAQSHGNPKMVERHEAMIESVRGAHAVRFDDCQDDAGYVQQVSDICKMISQFIIDNRVAVQKYLGKTYATKRVMDSLPFGDRDVLKQLKKIVKELGSKKEFKRLVDSNDSFKARIVDPSMLSFAQSLLTIGGLKNKKARNTFLMSVAPHADRPFETFTSHLDQLKARLEMSDADVISAMCDVLGGNALSRPETLDSLLAFQVDASLNGERFSTVLVDSLVGAICKNVVTTITVFRTAFTKMGLNYERDLVAFMSGSVVQCIVRDTWVQATKVLITTIREHMDEEKLKKDPDAPAKDVSKAMGDGLATRVEKETFLPMVKDWLGLGFTFDHVMRMIGSGSTVAQMVDDDVLSNLAKNMLGQDKNAGGWVMDHDSATKLLSKNGFSSRCDDDEFLDLMRWLRVEIALTTDQLVKVVGGSFAKYMGLKKPVEFKASWVRLSDAVGVETLLSMGQYNKIACKLNTSEDIIIRAAAMYAQRKITPSRVYTLFRGICRPQLDGRYTAVIKCLENVSAKKFKSMELTFCSRGSRRGGVAAKLALLS